MQTFFKRVFRLRLLLILFCFTAILIYVQTQKASAEVQTKYPYLIKVNRVYNTITIYEKDKDGKYTVPVKAILCSVGAKGQTKKGTYQTKEKYRWKLLMGGVWGQYSTRIVNGILFHSVYYYGKCNPATLATNEFNKLGTAASHGCIRLAVADAKWIYDHCSVGTTVVIYDNKKSPGPLGKPEAIKIPSAVRWDPTDPNTKNPYYNKKPVITGARDQKITWGKKVNLLKGIKAKSSLGVDITSKLTVKGKVNRTLPGKYKISYLVTDTLKRTAKKEITVTVKNNTVTPKFTGISDKIIGAGVTVNDAFARSGVKAYCSGIKLASKSIKVTIVKKNETEYYITYRVSAGNGPAATAHARVTVDNEAPVIAGVTDKTVENGEVPSTDYLLEGVTVSDNVSASDKIKLIVTTSQNTDGTYSVTYEAVDEAGNKAVKQSIVNIDK